MAKYLNVYGINRQKTAVLQNAFSISEEQELNNIYSLSFSLPSSDEKKIYCSPFHYFRFGDDGELYRMIRNPKERNEIDVDTISCEHVIATLCDNVLFGSYTYGGADTHTADVINFLLSKQTTQNWILKDCDFDFAYEYNWEQENLLNALYSIPKVFTEPYKWEFDTSVYPWRVSLKKINIDAHPDYYIMAKLNLVSDTTALDYTNICTRLYPLGYGEGVNQLTIRDANDGVPYLDAPASVIARYGIKEKVLCDRQFEDAKTLKAYAQTVLDALQEPSVTRSFDVVDLYPLTSDEIDKAEVGKIAELTEDGTITYVTKTTRVLDDPGNLQISLSTKPTDVASAIADLADRVRIESVYAQGATQLYQHSKDANATPEKGMVLSLYFPKEMKQINKVLLKLKLNRFRSYSQATDTNEAIVSTTTTTDKTVGTTTSSAAVAGTTESGGGVSKSTSTNGGEKVSVTTSSGGGNLVIGNVKGSSFAMTDSATDKLEGTSYPSYTEGIGSSYMHSHYIGLSTNGHKHSYYVPEHQHSYNLPNHTHEVNFGIGAHSHDFTIPMHKHEVTIPSHNHSVTIEGHNHKVTIPAHSHKITAGIFESGRPSSFSIYVEGEKKAYIDSTTYNDDITMWLLGSDGMVMRDRWIEMEIVPDDNAYVVASIFVQGFVQSRGGGNY